MVLKNFINPLWYLIEKYPEEDWSWHWISKNRNITWEIIENNPDYPWDWNGWQKNSGPIT